MDLRGLDSNGNEQRRVEVQRNCIDRLRTAMKIDGIARKSKDANSEGTAPKSYDVHRSAKEGRSSELHCYLMEELMKAYIHRQDLIYLCLAILVFFAFARWGEIETVDKPVETVATVAPTPMPTSTQEPTKPPYLLDDVPLSDELQTVLYESCMEAGIEYEVGLGLIEAESGFKSDAVSPAGCYGLCQLNPHFFPADLSEEDNIKAGIGYLGELLENYGDLDAALTAYNRGFDNSNRAYANKVMGCAEEWRRNDG